MYTYIYTYWLCYLYNLYGREHTKKIIQIYMDVFRVCIHTYIRTYARAQKHECICDLNTFTSANSAFSDLLRQQVN